MGRRRQDDAGYRDDYGSDACDGGKAHRDVGFNAGLKDFGFGKLRLDQGETVANAQEVAYLRILSSNVPQELMNACVM